jgi:hypothetical protein
VRLAPTFRADAAKAAAEPELERRATGAAYYRDVRGKMPGMRFRVHDLDLSGTKVRAVALESPEATHRIFLQADSARWSYAFRPDEDRTLDPFALERQLLNARYRMPDVRRGSPR